MAWRQYGQVGNFECSQVSRLQSGLSYKLNLAFILASLSLCKAIVMR